MDKNFHKIFKILWWICVEFLSWRTFMHFLTFLQKNLQHNFIKRGRGATAVYKLYKNRFFQDSVPYSHRDLQHDGCRHIVWYMHVWYNGWYDTCHTYNMMIHMSFLWSTYDLLLHVILGVQGEEQADLLSWSDLMMIIMMMIIVMMIIIMMIMGGW